MRSPARLTALAPAKLNLGLWIVRRRPDGYHDLVTLLQAIDLYDRLTVEARPSGLSLRCNWTRIPTDDANLVLRAARLLRRATGVRKGAAFRLTKRIPEGAGLGGGSSDAAAALVLLDRLWGTDLPAGHLARLAAEIGSDVPFFLKGGTQLARGRGTRLTPLELRETLHFVLVHGQRPIATNWAYSLYQKQLTASGPPPSIAALARGDLLTGASLRHLDNHLEAGLRLVRPDIEERRERLRSLGARPARLTGSGATVFGMFESRARARRALAALQARGWSVDSCRSVSDGVVVVG
jgi:4-diphosphocytidyl-2-C-methyl-D-erythritol kinase